MADVTEGELHDATRTAVGLVRFMLEQDAESLGALCSHVAVNPWLVLMQLTQLAGEAIRMNVGEDWPGCLDDMARELAEGTP